MFEGCWESSPPGIFLQHSNEGSVKGLRIVDLEPLFLRNLNSYEAKIKGYRKNMEYSSRNTKFSPWTNI